MNPRRITLLIAMLLAGAGLGAPARGQQSIAQQMVVLEERVNRLAEEVKALLFNQEQMQQQLRELQAQLTDMRRQATSPNSAELVALDARIKAVDAAREKDRQIILDQLAKELVALSAMRSGSAAPSAASGVEHVVKAGETLSTIARAYGVTVADLAQVNGITDVNTIRIGQKLLIPK